MSEVYKVDGKVVSQDEFLKIKKTLVIAPEETIRDSTDRGHVYTFDATELGTKRKFVYEEENSGDDRIYEIKKQP